MRASIASNKLSKEELRTFAVNFTDPYSKLFGNLVLNSTTEGIQVPIKPPYDSSFGNPFGIIVENCVKESFNSLFP